MFLTDYDSGIQPSYRMRHANNPFLTQSYDLPDDGVEIATGAQPEHRLKVLQRQAIEKRLVAGQLEHCFALFRHGMARNGGFGMGLARVKVLMLDQTSIRQTTFRVPQSLRS